MSKKINSPADLKALRDKAQSSMDLRSGDKDVKITVHMGTCGIAAGARTVLTQLVEELGDSSSSEHVTLSQSCCTGLCDQEPMLTLKEKGGKIYHYGKLDGKKVQEIVQNHVVSGKPVTEYMIDSKLEEETS